MNLSVRKKERMSNSMNLSRSKQLVEELKMLKISSPDIQASAIVSVDGLIIASALPANTGEDRVSAMSAALLSLGERISIELKRGNLNQVFIRGDLGYVIITSVGREAVLTVMAKADAKLGLIFFDINNTARKLEALI